MRRGDTPASLTTPVVLTTAATASSPVGRYMISAGGAASLDYTITFRSGTFNVTPVGPTVNPPPGLLNRARTTFTSSLYHNLLGRDPNRQDFDSGSSAVRRHPRETGRDRGLAIAGAPLLSADERSPPSRLAFRRGHRVPCLEPDLDRRPESIRRILGAGALGEFLMAIGLFF